MNSKNQPDYLSQAQSTSLLFLVLLTPLFVNLWVELQFEPSKVWLARTLIAGVGLLFFSRWVIANGGIQLKPFPPYAGPLFVALASTIVMATFFSISWPTALIGSLDRANGALTQLSYLLLFALVAAEIDMEKGAKLLTAAVLTAVPICLIGVAQAAGWQPLLVFTDGRSQLVTTLGRANFTAAYLALLIPLTLAAAQTTTHPLTKHSFQILVLLEVSVIALTQARAGLIAAAVGIIVFLWLQIAPNLTLGRRRIGFTSGIILFAGFLALTLQRGLASQGSIAARWTIWQASLRLLWPRLWLGYGADSLELVFPSVYPPELVYYQGRGIVVDRAHNWLLDWSLNYGIVSTILLGSLVYIVVRQSWHYLLAQHALSAESAAENRQLSWITGGIAAVCAQLVGNLFLFDIAATALLFWLVLAILTATTGSQTVKTVVFPLNRSSWNKFLLIGIVSITVGWGIWQSNVKPLLADIDSWAGTQLLNRGEVQGAFGRYEAAVAQQPFRPEYQVAKALTAAQLGQTELAESALLAAIKLTPNDPFLYTHLASIYGQAALQSQSAPQLEKAYGAFEQAIVLAPSIGLTYQRYADLALRAGDFGLAQQQASKAIDLDATDGVAFAVLGWSHLQNGDLLAAENAFEQAVKWEPTSADFYLGLATVYAQKGDLEAAKRLLNQSLRFNPAYPPALTLQLQLEDRR